MDTLKTVLIRGGGDLASGVAAVLHRKGWRVLICELPAPLVVRRKVSFAEAIWEGSCKVEEIEAYQAGNVSEIEDIFARKAIAVFIDPEMKILDSLSFDAIIDGRMLKRYEENPLYRKIPLIGLGPGFVAGGNCDAVIETKRGPGLGQAIFTGSAEENTGIPGIVNGYGLERVLYAPAEGVLECYVEIGDKVAHGQPIGRVGSIEFHAPFDGVVRGLARAGLRLQKGIKVGDIDPRMDVSMCYTISDKALLIGKGVLTALESILAGSTND